MRWLRKKRKQRDMDDVAIVQTDLRGQISAWSQGAETLFGHGANAALGKALDLIVPEQFRAQHWMGFRAAMERGSLSGGEPFVLPILCADGETRRFAGRLMLMRDAYGRSVGATAVFVPERTDADAPALYQL